MTEKELEEAGAETLVSFQDRIEDLLKGLLAEGGDVLLVSHNGVGKMITAIMSGNPRGFAGLPSFPHAQTTLLSAARREARHSS